MTLEDLLGMIEYDFREDDDDVQGHIIVNVNDNIVTIKYEPFDGSPYSASTRHYYIVEKMDDKVYHTCPLCGG